MARRKGKHPAARKAWDPLRRGPINPRMVELLRQQGDPCLPTEAWTNDTYQVVVRHRPDGYTHLSIKRNDRRPVRDWRHLQAIKNEVCGIDRWAYELFPPEAHLVDTANEYHLFVPPAEAEAPAHWGEGRAVLDAEQVTEGRVRGEHLARQRPWQPGLSTGIGLERLAGQARLA